MKQSLTLLLLLSIFFLGSSAMAQTYTVKGIITDRKSGEKMPYVNAALYRQRDTLFMRGATTGPEGRFEIKDVAPGQYLMMVTMVGYERWTQVTQVTGNLDLGTIALRPGTTLKEVEVVAEKPLYTMDGEKHIYSTTDDPSIQTGTASDALQNAPGVEVDADGNITLRGTESVDVWINDKPSHMSGESLKQYIRTLPANSIEKIEVITNPSARYGGGTPVVNIVTNNAVKRNEFVSFGLNASSRPEITPWVSYVFSNEKINFNIYANVGYDGRNMHGDGTTVMLDPHGDTVRKESYSTISDDRTINTYLGGHLNYTINKCNDISAYFGTYPYWNKWFNTHTTSRYERLDGTQPFSNFDYRDSSWTDGFPDRPGGGFYGGAWYTHKFDDSTGHKISFSYNVNSWASNRHYFYLRSYSWQPAEDIVYEFKDLGSDYNNGFEVNYTLPFGQRNNDTKNYANELQAGVEFDFGREITHDIYDTLNIHQDSTSWVLCEYLGAYYISHTRDLGAYLTYLRRFGNFSIKLGLRTKYAYERVDYYDDPASNIDTGFLSLTPSLHLSYHTKDMHNFSLSYTHRTNNPSASSLSTYMAYNLEDYSTGNPYLKASYSDRIEVMWDKYFDKFGSVGLQAYYTGNINAKGTLTDVIYSDFFNRVVSYSKPINIGSSYNAGIDAHVTYRPSAFVNVRFNASLFYDTLDVTYRPDQPAYRNGMWCYRLRLNAWAKLWKNYQFFVNAYYRSSTQNVFRINQSEKGVDLGANADFFDRRMTVKLNVSDIFNWGTWNSSIVNPFYATTSNRKYNSRFITLGITFRFGKMELAGMAQEGGGTSPNAISLE